MIVYILIYKKKNIKKIVLDKYNMSKQKKPQEFGFHHQDIEQLVIRGKRQHLQRKIKLEGVIHTKPNISDRGVKMAKLDASSESGKVKTVTAEISKLISEARNAKKLSQKQLAIQANITQAEVQKYENGTAQPNLKHIQKFQTILGVKLTGLHKHK